MHARFEISISRKHGGRDQIVIVNRFLDLRMKRPGIADAGRATVTDKIEAELIEICLQSGLGEIIGDHARSWRERSFHCRIDAQAALDRFLREQTGRQHHAWIARVRATRDRRDQDGAVSNLALPVMKRIGRFFFQFARRIRRRAIRHHLEFVAFFARLDALVRLVGRRHVAIRRRRAVQLHRVFRAQDRHLVFRNRHPSPVFAEASEKPRPSSGRLMRSCGRFGPATPGFTSPRFNSRSTL